jgi:hypothetical protein
MGTLSRDRGGFRGGGGRAVGAQAPVHDLRLVDHEPVIVGRGEAGSGTDVAVHVGDRPTGSTDDVVVVVTDT